MTDDFIRDNLSPGDPKTNFRVRPDIPSSQKFTATDYERFRQALLSIQSYLRAGLFDAALIHTIQHIDLTNASGPTVGPEQDWAGYRGRWFVGVDVANADTSRDFVLAGQRGTYSFSDGATTSGSPTLTSAARGGFVAALVGSSISGAGIPAGTTISAVGGTTSLTLSANATATATGVNVTVTRNIATDVVYLKHRGGLSPTVGVGVTPPDGSARLQVSAQDDEPAMGTIRLRRGPSQTGKVFTIHDSTPTDQLFVDKDFFLGSSAGVNVKADASAAGHVLTLCDPSGGNQYSFDQPTGSGGVLRVRMTTNNVSIVELGTDGSFRHLSSKLGFYGGSTVTKPTVAGSRGGNAALASLLTALANLGLVTDSTTP